MIPIRQSYDGVIQSAKAQKLKIQMIPIKFPSQAAGLPDGCENMDALNSPELSQRIFHACKMLQEPLENLLRKLRPKPSCIVSTNAIPWTQKLAEKLNIPRYNFETVSCFTLFCSRMIEDRGNNASDKDKDTYVLPGICHKIEFTKAQLPQASCIELDGYLDIVREIKQVSLKARGTLINTFQELEPWYLDKLREFMGNVWTIGPVSLCNKEVSEKSNRGDQTTVGGDICLTWLDSMRPKSVIYVCFGSLCHIPMSQIKEIGSGLEESGHPFIWIIRKQDYSEELEEWLSKVFEERVIGRGLVIRGWAPQVLILSHPSVGGFLTHCGWNSTLEGICAGVPMITWPMFAEQFYNEKFVVSVLEIGVMVGVESCMSKGDLVKGEKVKLAVEKLMDGEEGAARRKRVEEIAKKAKEALEEGGSSYTNSIMLIQDVMKFNGDVLEV